MCNSNIKKHIIIIIKTYFITIIIDVDWIPKTVAIENTQVWKQKFSYIATFKYIQVFVHGMSVVTFFYFYEVFDLFA